MLTKYHIPWKSTVQFQRRKIRADRDRQTDTISQLMCLFYAGKVKQIYPCA